MSIDNFANRAGDAGFEEHIAALNEVFDRDSVDGLLCCDRITKVYSEKISAI